MEEQSQKSFNRKQLVASEDHKSEENYVKNESKLVKIYDQIKQQIANESSKLSANNQDQQHMRTLHVGQYNLNYGHIKKGFMTNEIKTSQYNCFNFLPKNLFKQLSKLVNSYFLLVMILQVIRPISNSRGQPIILFPLLFVMSLAGAKDIVEDVKRHKSDCVENNRKCLAANRATRTFQEIEWKNLKVGMVVKIKKNEYFPADLVLLNSSESKGVCYIETKTIDGETNLKHKSSLKNVQNMIRNDEEAINFNAQVVCEKPNEMIYKFTGVMTLEDSQNTSQQTVKSKTKQLKLSLNYEHFLLRGASLKSTDYIYGVVIFTGHETKIMQNSSEVRHKMSKVEKSLQSHVTLIFVFELILCLFCSMYGTLWEKANAFITEPYLDLDAQSYQHIGIWFKDSFKRVGTWMLIFTNFVPISMQATLDCVKLAQGWFMSWDVSIYDQVKDLPVIVQSSNLNEELGQVSYLFTDKTGTLTQNNMEFKKFSAGLFSYGKSGTNLRGYMKDRRPDLDLDEYRHVNFEDDDCFKHLLDPDHENYKKVHEVLLFLAICHTIVVEDKGGKKILNSSSPDELALVQGAKYLGYSFLDRDSENNILIDKFGTGIIKFQLLYVIEFTSDRKRMSVIIKDQNNVIRLLCKGADSVIAERLDNTIRNEQMLEQTLMYQQEYAREGLRTLLLAQKIITPEQLMEWGEAYTRASTQLTNREEMMNQQANIIEQNLELVGSTAIEDKLQDEVGQTIAAIKEAGINIWVLTGDKVETAINIGYSCNLLDNRIAQSVINAKDYQLLLEQLGEAQKQQVICIGTRQEQAIVVSGESLLMIQSDLSILERFIDITQKTDVVIACRVSPKQKADIVQMIRAKDPTLTTLAIGDGANDVNMINMAHVGVGINGLEGQQASRNADYAIGQFKHLRQLLFVHGREAYRRNSYLIIYIFYKNIIFVMPQFFFGFVNAFSGASIYEPWLYQFYNILFTAMPIIWYAIFDFEYSKEQLYSTPKHYIIGPTDQCFNTKRFWLWIIKGTLEGALLLFLILYSFEVYSVNHFGQPSSIWVTGAVLYQGIVMITNVQLMYQSNIHTIYSFVIQILSVASFFLVYYVENLFKNFPELFATYYYIWTANQFYFVMIFEFQITFFYEKLEMYFLDMSAKYLFRLRGRHGSLQRFMTKMNQIDSEFPSRNYIVMQHRGFAFSQEPGQAPQLIHDLEQAYIRFNSFQRYIHSATNEQLEYDLPEEGQSDNARLQQQQRRLFHQNNRKEILQSQSNMQKQLIFPEGCAFQEIIGQSINSPTSRDSSINIQKGMHRRQNNRFDSHILLEDDDREDLQNIQRTLALGDDRNRVLRRMSPSQNNSGLMQPRRRESRARKEST